MGGGEEGGGGEALRPYDPEHVPAPFGLHNTGVICHLNSLLQALASCPSVIRGALEGRASLARTGTGRAFYDFARAAAPPPLREGAPPPFGGAGRPLEGLSAAVLRALVGDLRARKPGCRYGPGQESASEGLVLLLEMLEAGGECPVGRLFQHRYRTAAACGGCGREAPAGAGVDEGVQFNLFHYDPRAPPATPEAFAGLLLEQASPLEGLQCKACGATRGARRYRLRLAPEVLAVVFNLYGTPRPPRYFPPRLTLPGPLAYRQVAQVEHFGSLGGGHYVARGLRAGGASYLFNDAAARPAPLEATPNVYMVFYHHCR